MNRSLRALTADGDRDLLRIPARLTLLDVARDGRVLLLRVSWRAEAIWRGADSRDERDLSWLDHSNVADLSADGARLLLRETGDGGGARYRTYLRETSGADALWLGEGVGAGIGPSGAEVLVSHPDRPAELEVVPVGAGQPRPLAPGGLDARLDAGWFPDGRRVVFTGVGDGNTTRRIYVQELDGEPRPLSPPGWIVPSSRAVSPDGAFVVGRRWGQPGLFLWPVAGGEPRPLPRLERGERFAGWRGHELLLLVGGPHWRVVALDPDSGARSDVVELGPSPDELMEVRDFRMAANGAYAYTRMTHNSELYLVSGIR
jgi:hypothetical protein